MMNYASECPLCSKRHQVDFTEFLVEATCPSCKYCYGPVYYFDPVHATYQEQGFREQLQEFIAHSKNKFSHAVFLEGLKNKTLTVLFPIVDAWVILPGWRRVLWTATVVLYRFGPLIASVLVTWITRNLWFLGGIVAAEFFGRTVSAFLRRPMQQIQVIGIFSVIGGTLGFIYGFRHWSVFSVFCVILRVGVFFYADALQNKLAVAALSNDERFFERLRDKGLILLLPPQPGSSWRMRKM